MLSLFRPNGDADYIDTLRVHCFVSSEVFGFILFRTETGFYRATTLNSPNVFCIGPSLSCKLIGKL